MSKYRKAIKWIVDNDDVDFLYDGHGVISVTACLVADLFNKTEAQVIKDLLKADTADRSRVQKKIT